MEALDLSVSHGERFVVSEHVESARAEVVPRLSRGRSRARLEWLATKSSPENPLEGVRRLRRRSHQSPVPNRPRLAFVAMTVDANNPRTLNLPKFVAMLSNGSLTLQAPTARFIRVPPTLGAHGEVETPVMDEGTCASMALRDPSSEANGCDARPRSRLPLRRRGRSRCRTDPWRVILYTFVLRATGKRRGARSPDGFPASERSFPWGEGPQER